MTISFTRYVDIVSGVAVGQEVRQRDLILRLFTDNELLPPQSFIEFTSATDVADYFGGTSTQEYLRAASYFSWISKNLTRAQRIAYARYVSAAVAPMIFGGSPTTTLATWQAIEDGSFGLTIGADVNTFTALDFSAIMDLSDVADILQTAIRTKTGTMWTAATVTYDSTRNSFNFVGGSETAADISAQDDDTGTPILNTIGWKTDIDPYKLIFAAGSAVETPVNCITASAAASDNFASFTFMTDLTIDEVVSLAEWNEDQNVKYVYCVAVDTSTYSDWSAALIGYGGTTLTFNNSEDQFPEQNPAVILAATNYNAPNSVQNYMFQLFPNQTAQVTTNELANTLDLKRINYVGLTQTAGQYLAFYQRGLMMGGSDDPIDQNVYANEVWLKDAAGAAIMSLLLSASKISANAKGRSQLFAILQSVINLALSNGTISAGKTLTDIQKTYIGEITNSSTAWYQVQNLGYWLNWVISPIITEDSRTEFVATYTLVYSKDDTVRKINGSNVLI